MKYVHSKSYDKSRLLEVLSLDDIVYEKKYRGTFESVSNRYKTNEEMFIFAVDDEDKMCGYICFFPVSDELYNRILNDEVIYDDNIESKDVKQYTKNEKNNVFIISVALLPEYMGQGIGFNLVKEMFSYLNTLSCLGYEIGDILAYSTSTRADRLFAKFNFKKEKTKEEYSLQKFEFINYKDMDLYLFIPVKYDPQVILENKDSCIFLEKLTKASRLEINSLLNDRIKRVHLAKEKFAPEDDYGNPIGNKTLDGNLFLSYYRDIGTLIIEFQSISFDPTFVLDQASRSSLKVKINNEELLLDKYISRYGLEILGNANHLLVSKEPLHPEFRKFVLFAESFFNRVGTKIVSKDAQYDAENNIAQYDFANIYASGIGVSFEINAKTYKDKRLDASMNMIYIYEILALEIASLKLLQNTITKEFDNSPKPSIDIIEGLIENYGKYLILFEYNFKYFLSKIIGDQLANKFNLPTLRKEYQANVEQLNRIVSIRSERKAKEYSKKQDAFFKLFSIFTLLLSINNIISLFVNVNFTNTKSIIVFIITILIWLIAIGYFIKLWVKSRKKVKE